MSIINISKNPIQHCRTKHIDIRHHFIRELDRKINVLEYISTKTQLANIFIELLGTQKFIHFGRGMGVCIFE